MLIICNIHIIGVSKLIRWHGWQITNINTLYDGGFTGFWGNNYFFGTPIGVLCTHLEIIAHFKT